MKCKYRFAVDGKIKPSVNVPIPARGWVFDLETANGVLTHIAVTVPLPNPEYWPKVESSPESEVKAHITTQTPHLPFVQQELRSVQGLLSLFGLRSIDMDNIEVEWIPENQEEDEALQIYSFSVSLGESEDSELYPLPFDLIARSIIAADIASEIDVPLNFFRRGMNDIYDGSYIEAIYDFYFILETLFADGKFRKAEVIEKFSNATDLVSAIEQVLSDPREIITRKSEVRDAYSKKYGQMHVNGAIEQLVDLRGYLHHHTLKRKDGWHPENQIAFEIDALFLQSVTFKVVFKLAEQHLWSEQVIDQYEQLAGRR